jgi:hypothetical protein
MQWVADVRKEKNVFANLHGNFGLITWSGVVLFRRSRENTGADH